LGSAAGLSTVYRDLAVIAGSAVAVVRGSRRLIALLVGGPLFPRGEVVAIEQAGSAHKMKASVAQTWRKTQYPAIDPSKMIAG
jgi:hypothetical protein